MSYSFFVRAASVAAAVAAVAPKFDEVVASQPIHAADKDAAVAVATAIAALVGEPGDGQEVAISVSGWLQWVPLTQEAHAAGELPTEFTGASVSVQATIVAKAEE